MEVLVQARLKRFGAFENMQEYSGQILMHMICKCLSKSYELLLDSKEGLTRVHNQKCIGQTDSVQNAHYWTNEHGLVLHPKYNINEDIIFQIPVIFISQLL